MAAQRGRIGEISMMTKSAVRRALLASICLGTLALSTPAVAQDAPTPNPAPSTVPTEEGALPAEVETQDAPAQGSDQEIVVTARRRNEALQDVPIAVTAYSSEQLERQGALDITDVADTTPNVTLESSRATNSTLTAFIRGVGQQDPVAGFEQGVGIYLDDVYLNRPQGAVLDIYDVERIEILRGPQGTLYGRNTVGGAVKYVTRRLSDVPTVNGRVNIGTDEQLDVIMSASTPLAEGFSIGAAAARLSRGGFGESLTTGKDNYDKDVIAVRGTAELEPSDAVFFRLSGDWTWDNSNPRAGSRMIPGLFSGTPPADDVFDTLAGPQGYPQKVDGGGVALLGEIAFGEGFKFRSISAWRKDDTKTWIDFDALPLPDFEGPAIYKNRQTSQELQLLYESNRLNALIGFYYLDAKARTTFDVRVYTLLPGLAAFTDSAIGTKTSAIFGDVSYDLSDQFSISVGGRYTWDKRTGDIFRQRYLGGGSPIFGGAGIPFLVNQTDFEGSAKFRKFTPRASVTFEPSDDHTLYASYSQGFKGGGFDPRSSTANAPDLDNDGTISTEEVSEYVAFDPETVDNFELGWKGSLLDRRLNFAAAAFVAKYKDVQIPGSVPCISGGGPSFCGVVDNAGKARIRGFELETNATLAQDFAGAGDRLGFAGTLGYIDAKYTEYFTNIPVGTPPVNTPTDVSEFRQFQNTPKWTLSGSLDYSTPAFGGRLSANASLSYRSKTYQFEVPNVFDQSGYALVDANILWRSRGNRFTIGLHGKNLTDKEYITSGYNFLNADPVTGELIKDANGNYTPGAGLGREGVLTAFYGNPRQIWVSFGFNY
jgi:iron complex outermembrane receptor protein